jgi:GNAT superfamily N-acetyltransferase
MTGPGGSSYNTSMHTGPFIVRPYRPADREALRRLAVETAEIGGPSEGIWGDREALADFLTDYYLSDEPGSAWVAERGGQVLGYVSGCLDTRRFLRRMSLWWGPRGFTRALGRGFWRKDFWKGLARSLGEIPGTRSYRSEALLDACPAHLHINLDPSLRGGGVGRRLVEIFLQEARRRGARGVHLATREDNQGGRAFFERLGFRDVGRSSVPSFAAHGPARHGIVVYSRDL